MIKCYDCRNYERPGFEHRGEWCWVYEDKQFLKFKEVSRFNGKDVYVHNTEKMQKELIRVGIVKDLDDVSWHDLCYCQLNMKYDCKFFKERTFMQDWAVSLGLCLIILGVFGLILCKMGVLQ